MQEKVDNRLGGVKVILFDAFSEPRHYVILPAIKSAGGMRDLREDTQYFVLMMTTTTRFRYRVNEVATVGKNLECSQVMNENGKKVELP